MKYLGKECFRGQIRVKNSLEWVKFFIQFGKWQEKTLKKCFLEILQEALHGM